MLSVDTTPPMPGKDVRFRYSKLGADHELAVTALVEILPEADLGIHDAPVVGDACRRRAGGEAFSRRGHAAAIVKSGIAIAERAEVARLSLLEAGIAIEYQTRPRIKLYPRPGMERGQRDERAVGANGHVRQIPRPVATNSAAIHHAAHQFEIVRNNPHQEVSARTGAEGCLLAGRSERAAGRRRGHAQGVVGKEPLHRERLEMKIPGGVPCNLFDNVRRLVRGDGHAVEETSGAGIGDVDGQAVDGGGNAGSEVCRRVFE